MQSRRIQLVGKRSYTISLPKDWVLKNNLKEKNLLFLEEINNDIIISKGEETIGRKKVEVDLKKINDIENFLLFCYLKDVERIILKFDKIKKEEIANIKKIIKKLEGYKILNESNQSLEIFFFFHEFNITLQDTIKRIIFLLNEMIEKIANGEADYLDEIENSVDSLNYLNRRILASCVNNPKKLNQNKLTNSDEIFFYLILTRKLERIGDLIYEYRFEKFSKEDIKIIKEILGYLDNFFYLRKKDHNFNFKKKTHSSLNLRVEKVLDRIEQLVEDVYFSFYSINLNNSFKEILK